MEASFHKVAKIKTMSPRRYSSGTQLDGKFQLIILYDSDNRRVGEVVIHMTDDCQELRPDE